MQLTKELLEEEHLKNGLCFKEIAEKYQLSSKTVAVYASRFGIRNSRLTKNLVGKKIGTWTVIKQVESRHKTTNWLVRCKCGKECIKQYGHVNTGLRLKCLQCSTYEKRKKDEFNQTFFGTIIAGAKKRNLEFTLTKEFLFNLYEKQNRKCALTGLDIDFSSPKYRVREAIHLATASLDRIDSTKGYIEGNVQWVHRWINHMKWSLKQDDFIFMCKQVSNFSNVSKNYKFDDSDNYLHYKRKTK